MADAAKTLAVAAEVLNFFFSVVVTASAAYWLQAECDKPLAPLLLVLGVVFLISTSLTLVLQLCAGSKVSTTLRPFYVRFGLLLGGVFTVWLLLSNIFIFTSSTCAQTSAARPFWGSTLYNMSWWCTVVADVCIGLTLLCCSNQLWAFIDNYRDYVEDQRFAEARASEAAAGSEAQWLKGESV